MLCAIRSDSCFMRPSVLYKSFSSSSSISLHFCSFPDTSRFEHHYIPHITPDINTNRFWPRTVMKLRICYNNVCLSVCLSVCSSHSWVMPKQLKISKCASRHTIAGCSRFHVIGTTSVTGLVAVASLRFVSSGAVTDCVSYFFYIKKLTTFYSHRPLQTNQFLPVASTPLPLSDVIFQCSF